MPALRPPSPATLLRWYDTHQRVMPWRAATGKNPNPYHVLLSEFMLQQTQVQTVIPYFNAFLKRWPDVRALAHARLENVRAAWSGLGYYRRAKFLHDCARAIVKEHGGIIPQDEEVLLKLPGIGAYTAAAITAIAFDKKANVIDGNVERVMARIFAVGKTMPAAKTILRQKAASCLPQKRFGDYAQALMDLGAGICTPKKPQCGKCPWQKNCAAFAMGKAEAFPSKTKAKKTPQKSATVFIVMNARREVLLHRRAEGGLLGGFWEFPSSAWTEKQHEAKQKPLFKAPPGLRWQKLDTRIIHVFSHFKLTLALRASHSRAIFFPENGEYRWLKWQDLSTIPLPTVMRKVADEAEKHFHEEP